MLRRFRFPVSSMVVVSLGSSATAPLRFLGSQSNGNGNGSSGGGSGSSQTSSVSYGELRQALTVFGFQSSSGSVQVTVADVKKRYIELAKQYHPDVVSVRAHASPSTSTEVMIKINEAHETLIRAGKCGMLHSGVAAAVPGQRGTSHAAADAKRPSNNKNGSSSQSSTRKPSADYSSASSSKMRRPAEDRYQHQHSSNTKSANANSKPRATPTEEVHIPVTMINMGPTIRHASTRTQRESISAKRKFKLVGSDVMREDTQEASGVPSIHSLHFAPHQHPREELVRIVSVRLSTQRTRVNLLKGTSDKIGNTTPQTVQIKKITKKREAALPHRRMPPPRPAAAAAAMVTTRSPCELSLLGDLYAFYTTKRRLHYATHS